jgi:hypothetical protein
MQETCARGRLSAVALDPLKRKQPLPGRDVQVIPLRKLPRLLLPCFPPSSCCVPSAFAREDACLEIANESKQESKEMLPAKALPCNKGFTMYH